MDFPVTFEDTANIDYALADFGGNASAIVVDPTDMNNLVASAIKTADAMTWAGTTIGVDGLTNAVPFTTTATKISVRVWSPDANIPIRLKVEDKSDPTISVETEAMTTKAMEWETLEFDFSNHADGTPALDLAQTYDKISIFFNFGTDGATAGEKTYYWDDVVFLGTVGLNDLTVWENALTLTPNPASDQCQIQLTEPLTQAVQLMVFDINGKLMHQRPVTDQTTICSHPVTDQNTVCDQNTIRDQNSIGKQNTVCDKHAICN